MLLLSKAFHAAATKQKFVLGKNSDAKTNVETSYITQLKICYLMTTFLLCPWQELLQLKCWRDRQEVRSEDQGTQERSWLFHSWYTDPSLQGKGEQCNSQVSHHRPCCGRETCHRLGQGKSGRQRGTATDQMDKRGTWIRKTPSCMNRDAGSYQLSHTWDQVISRSRAPSSCKQSRRDQDVRLTSKCCH